MSKKTGASDGAPDPATPAQAPVSEGASPSLLQTLLSVAAAFFGVQSQRNYERDFTKGRAGLFIAMGLLMTIVFIVILLVIVRILLHHAGA